MSEKIIALLEKELDKIGDTGELSNSSLDIAYTLAKTRYYIIAGDAMEAGDGYSGDYVDEYYSGRRGRDSMGRYVSRNDNSRSSYGRGNRYDDGRHRMNTRTYNGGYSGHQDDMMYMLDDMMEKSSDSKERETIQKLMNQMDR